MNDLTVVNKLVRDRWPAMLAADGGRALLTIVTGDELMDAIRRKIVEEANELASSENRTAIIAKLADLTEILNAFTARLGIRETEVFEAKNSSRRANGVYENGNFLISVSKESVSEVSRRMLGLDKIQAVVPLRNPDQKSDKKDVRAKSQPPERTAQKSRTRPAAAPPAS